MQLLVNDDPKAAGCRWISSHGNGSGASSMKGGTGFQLPGSLAPTSKHLLLPIIASWIWLNEGPSPSPFQGNLPLGPFLPTVCPEGLLPGLYRSDQTTRLGAEP